MSTEKSYEIVFAEVKAGLNQSYLDMVDKYAESKSPVEFANSSLSHACYISFKMFENATDEILILSGTLTEIYFKKIKIALAKAAEKYIKVKLITLQEKNPKRIRDFYSFIDNIKNKDSKIDMEYLPLIYTGNPKEVRHYYVVDKQAWRIEDVHSLQINHDDIHATVCFNDKSRGVRLAEAFMSIWNEVTNKKDTNGL